MATVFGYSPDTGEGNYSTIADPAAAFGAGGFVRTGVIVGAFSTRGGQPIPVDPNTGLRPEVWVRNGPGDLNAPAPGNPPPNMTVLELLGNSIGRATPNVAWTKSFPMTQQQIRDWYLAHPTAIVFAVFQP